MTLSNEDSIINTIEIKSDVRTVQPTQLVFDLAESLLIPANGTREIFFNFEDPVTTLETIDSFVGNTAEDGSGSDATSDISVTDSFLFTTAVKVEFTNSSSNNVYLIDLLLYGTPAKVTKNIYLKEIDQSSIDKFEERILTIENNFIQTEDGARSLALTILNYYSDYTNTIELEVKGNHALQLNDVMTVQVDNINQEYVITKITNILSGGKFTQRLTGKIFNIPNFFILSSNDTAMSLLDGSDVLTP